MYPLGYIRRYNCSYFVEKEIIILREYFGVNFLYSGFIAYIMSLFERISPINLKTVWLWKYWITTVKGIV